MTDRRPPQPAADADNDVYARWMARLTDFAGRLRWPIVLVTLALTVLFAQYAARNLGINSNTNEMLSKDLAFRQIYDRFQKAFPLDSDNMTVKAKSAHLEEQVRQLHRRGGHLRQL